MEINTKLVKGSILNIYTDYQENRKYEGKALLIEKIRDGDSYYLADERLKPKDEKEYSQTAKRRILIYNRLISFFKGTENKKSSIYCRRLYRDLLQLRKDRLGDYEKMVEVLKKFRKKHQNSIKRIGSLLREYNDYYIIRFIQQDRRTWRPSIFSYERWKVRMIEDAQGWPSNWTTQRNIRILKCLNPSETMRRSQLIEFTTYDGMSSRLYERIRYKRKYRENTIKNKEKNKNKSTFIDDEEMENLISERLNKNIEDESN